ncbi:MAG: hypothetical protein FJ149_02350 [Euryarchaeota archaeon]|nr:hypothetical protein [Euryarchaeota archaeon]
MECHQARGYFLEGIVQTWLQESGFLEVKHGKVRGRSTDHEIDAYGISSFNLPFIYPIKLLTEAKWHTYSNQHDRHIGPDVVRNFFGKIIDIDQNYFRRKRSSMKMRYLHHGAIFSVTPFSSGAQEFAWGHGIYLIPLGGYTILRKFLEQALSTFQKHFISSKHQDDLYTKAKCRKLGRKIAKEKNQDLYFYSGILNQHDYVFIVANQEFYFQPDTDLITENPIASKDFRLPGEERLETLFHFSIPGSEFEICLPRYQSDKIIKSIKRTRPGNQFAFIDIPMNILANGKAVRRLFRIKLALPD